MNRWRLLILGLILILLTAGCRPASPPVTTNQEFTGSGTVPVLIGAIRASTNTPAAMANDELTAVMRQAKRKYGVQVQVISPADFLTLEEALKYFGENQAKGVLVAEPEAAALLPAIREHYPETRFEMLAAGETLPVKDLATGVYLAGSLAGHLVPQGNLTVIFPPDKPGLAALEPVLRAGILGSNSQAVLTIAAGGSENVTGDLFIAMHPAVPAKTPAQGIAVLTGPNPGTAGFWVVQNSSIAQGTIANQVEKMFQPETRQPNAGALAWEVYYADKREGQNRGAVVKKPLPPELAEKIEEIRQELQTGAINLPNF
ncbi:MAG: hypothetical protein PHU78_04010 [Heliobacteriaceae bacterium]|nr:hypothetical protein [Heliobacteriaceae bacterium]